MKAKSFLLLFFLTTFFSTIWGSGLEEIQLSFDQLLQTRRGLEKLGYTPTDILEKRLAAFTQELLGGKTDNFQEERSLSFYPSGETKFPLDFEEGWAFFADISDMQINNENFPATYNQRLPCVSMFDDKNFIAVWEDERNGDFDIFAQKVDFYGTPTGNNFEASEEDYPRDQLLPGVATVGDTAFVVVWVDEENYDIYGRRFRADLSSLGDVFQVNDAGIFSSSPSLACGPDGGFVVSWVDTRSGSNIYAKRFNASGSPLGSSFKVNEDAGTMPHLSPSVSLGENGSFVIVWEDFRNVDSDIYAQRYSSAGTKLGTNIMINSDSLNEDQYSPNLSLGKNNLFMVSWVDLRSGVKNVFARIFSFNGTPRTSFFKVDTTTTSDPRENPWVASDTTGRYVVTWTDYSLSFPAIYSQRFDSLGQGIEPKLTVSDEEVTGERHDPTLSTNPAGAFVACWMDKRNSNYDIYARTVRSDGFPQQDNNFMLNDDSSGGNQMAPSITTKSDGAFMVVWEDFRNGNSDIYLKRFDSSGVPLGNEIRVNDSLGQIYHGLPDIAGDSSGNFVVVWEDAREGSDIDIYAQLFNYPGNPAGANFMVNADTGTQLNNSPSCDMSPSGDFVVVWSANKGNAQNVYGRCFESNGEPKDTTFKINDDSQEVDHLYPRVSMDSLGNFTVAWEDRRNSENRVYLQRYNYNGVKLGDNFPVQSDNPSPTQGAPDLDLNKSGEFVVVWVESNQLLAQRYNSSATPTGNNIVVVDNPLSSPENPKIKMTDNGYFVVTWTDHRGGGSDIYLQTFLNGSAQGQNRLVNTDAGQSLQFSADIDLWGNLLYSVWMDNRIADHGFDIFFNTINFKETAVEDEDEEKELPFEFALYQNYPNPFNPTTTIPFTVHGSQFMVRSPIHTTQEKAVDGSLFVVRSPIRTSLKIYNIRGQLVKTLVEEDKTPGDYTVIWNGRDNEGKELASGIYFYQLKVGTGIVTMKMLLLR